MIDNNTKLTMVNQQFAVYTDFSKDAANFDKDLYTITADHLNGYIYAGYHKPINSLYFNVSTPVASNTLTFEYWNGTTWTAITDFTDDTEGFSRAGCIQWERELDDNATTTVDGKTKYWYRWRGGTNTSGLVLAGVNILFSDDYEMSLEQPYINNAEFLGDETSHIKIHAAVRNEIIQKFRNKNYLKTEADGTRADINAWDLLDIHEVKLAATYLAISKIYYNMSDNPEDVWESKAAVYNDKFNKYIELARLTVDTDDDGLISDVENKAVYKTRFMNR